MSNQLMKPVQNHNLINSNSRLNPFRTSLLTGFKCRSRSRTCCSKLKASPLVRLSHLNCFFFVMVNDLLHYVQWTCKEKWTNSRRHKSVSCLICLRSYENSLGNISVISQKKGRCWIMWEVSEFWEFCR